SKLRPTAADPVKLYLSDIDNNGTIDPLLTYSIDGHDYTFLGKGDLEKEVPILKKKFLYYHDFAGKDVHELFGDSLKDKKPLTATSFTSGVFFNKGKGQFEFKAFPSQAQASPLFGFTTVNGNVKYILAGGNFSGVIPYEGRYDADYGDFISMNQGRSFQWLSPASDGFLLRGEVRDIKAIKTSSGIIYAVAFNKKALRFFKLDQ
ncbi:MAG TPA: hypothetical protein VHS53_16955, partial [Mucilaginibacter sp.]|nr:hypothetical protein [Mucilaginibacter sp.]